MQLFPDINDSVHININSVPPWYSQCPLGPCYQHPSTNFKCQRCDFKSYLLISKVSLLTFVPGCTLQLKNLLLDLFLLIFSLSNMFSYICGTLFTVQDVCAALQRFIMMLPHFTFINKIKMQLLQFRCHFCLGFYNTLVSCAALL